MVSVLSRQFPVASPQSGSLGPGGLPVASRARPSFGDLGTAEITDKSPDLFQFGVQFLEITQRQSVTIQGQIEM